jgi:hypothetical protein
MSKPGNNPDYEYWHRLQEHEEWSNLDFFKDFSKFSKEITNIEKQKILIIFS